MLELIWGGFITLLGLIAWIGQLIYALSPAMGNKFGFGEAEADVDAVFYIDARGEAIWDSMIIWTLPLAGILLILQHPYWPYVALVSGGSYLYFSGRNLVTRLMMQRRDIRIGSLNNIRIANLFIPLWGLAAVITIILAVMALTDVAH